MKYATKEFLENIALAAPGFFALSSYIGGIENFPVLHTISVLFLSIYTIYYFSISCVLVLSLTYSLCRKKPLKQNLTPFFTLLFLTAVFLFFQYNAQSIKTPLVVKEGSSLKIVSANIHLESKIDDKLVNYVQQKNADVVVLLEVSSIHVGEIAEYFKEYPYKQVIPQDNAFGLAVLSKRPTEFVTQHIENIPYIQAKVSLEGEIFDLFGIHAFPPMIPTFTKIRSKQIEHFLSNTNQNTIVIGDFNAVEHDYVFQNKPMQLVPGHSITWPNWGQHVFGIGIDHAFISKNLTVLRSEVGKNTNSDHYPIYIEVIK